MLITALAAAAALQAAPEAFHYSVDIEARENAAAEVRITIDFPGQADGDTRIDLPDEWGGESELWRNLADIRLEGGELIQGVDTHQRIARHEPGAPLRLSYRLVQDREGDPTAEADDNYRPWVRPDYVHLLGNTVFARIEGLGEHGVSVDISAPQDWSLASDLEHGVADARALTQSVIVAGDFRLIERDVAGAPMRVAVRGDIGFSDEVFADGVEQVLRANQLYWGTGGEPFLVTALPMITTPGQSSLGGTNLYDSFAFFASDNGEAFILLRILQHEHVHTWVPGRLGGLSEGEAQIGEYWFSEGFTDFMTQRAGVLGGVWDAQTALGNWNEFLAELDQSPVRAAPNSEILTGFWTQYEYQRLPYLRGMVFAGLLDHLIRTETGGAQDLDDVMLALRDSADQGPAAGRLVQATLETTGIDISGLYQRHIIAGEPIALPEDAFGACGPVEQFERPRFVYGMEGEFNADDEFVLTAVDPEGPAAAAGFEPGMAIVRTGGAYGDATVDSVFRARLADGSQRELSYRPTDGVTESGQRIVPAEGDLQTNGCAALIAGRQLD